MITKQKITVIVLAACFAVMLVVYFAVIAPMTSGDSTASTEPAETVYPDEAYSSNNRIMMFEHIAQKNIQSIEVTNGHGTYTFYRDSSDEFQIKGSEGVSYDLELFSSLVVSTGYTVTKQRVSDTASEAELAQYGLDAPQASWVITSTAGKSYRVFVGSELVTGGGYYCAVEGRAAVYVLDGSLADTVLQPIKALVSPTLIAGLSSNDYYLVDNFKIIHGDELFLHIAIKDNDEKKNPEAILENKLVFPSGYEPNTDKFYNILYTYLTLEGDSVEMIGADDISKNMYGVLNPAYKVSFEYKGYTYEMSYSEKQNDGSYYCISNLNPTVIVKCSGDNFKYLDDGIIEWISSTVFSEYITNISTITVNSKDVNEKFFFSHGVEEDSENATLDIMTESGVSIPNDDITNFRQYYRTLLSIEIQDFTPLSEDEAEALKNDASKHMLTFTYKTLTGDETVISFYRYTNRHAMITVNGYGEFFVITDLVEKIVNDTVRVVNGEVIDSYGKN